MIVEATAAAAASSEAFDTSTLNVIVAIVNIVLFLILAKVARGHRHYFKTKDHPDPEMRHKHHGLVESLKGLPLIKKLSAKKTRKHMLGITIGIGIMLTGSTMAVNHHHFHEIPANLWDGFAYFLHGIGAIPLVKHIEPLWLLFVTE